MVHFTLPLWYDVHYQLIQFENDTRHDTLKLVPFLFHLNAATFIALRQATKNACRKETIKTIWYHRVGYQMKVLRSTISKTRIQENSTYFKTTEAWNTNACTWPNKFFFNLTIMERQLWKPPPLLKYPVY